MRVHAYTQQEKLDELARIYNALHGNSYTEPDPIKVNKHTLHMMGYAHFRDGLILLVLGASLEAVLRIAHDDTKPEETFEVSKHYVGDTIYGMVHSDVEGHIDLFAPVLDGLVADIGELGLNILERRWIRKDYRKAMEVTVSNVIVTGLLLQYAGGDEQWTETYLAIKTIPNRSQLAANIANTIIETEMRKKHESSTDRDA